MSPGEGVALWKQYMQPLAAQGYKLGAPATSSNPNGLVWVKSFIQQCDGCTIDFIPVHWYDVSASSFIAYVELWHNAFNKPIWVTEWACQNFNGGAQCSASDVKTFLETTTAWLDQQWYVERYAWFGAMRNMQGVNTDK